MHPLTLTIQKPRGVTIIELLLAVAIIAIVVGMISIFFPKASQDIVTNRQRWLASNLAASKIEDLKKQPYQYLAVASNFPGSAPNCDCTKLSAETDFTNLQYNPAVSPPPWQDVIQSTGTVYRREWCVNYVTLGASGSAPPNCGTDTGAKYVRVHVVWDSGSGSGAFDQEAVIIR